jgi:hypothetical protein
MMGYVQKLDDDMWYLSMPYHQNTAESHIQYLQTHNLI